MFKAGQPMLKVLGCNNSFTSFIHEYVGEINRVTDITIPATPLAVYITRLEIYWIT